MSCSINRLQQCEFPEFIHLYLILAYDHIFSLQHYWVPTHIYGQSRILCAYAMHIVTGSYYYKDGNNYIIIRRYRKGNVLSTDKYYSGSVFEI